jgi:acyl dehydratase
MPKYWEDFNVGDIFVTRGRTVTEAMISITSGLSGHIAPLFWDEEAAKKTTFGGRITPGLLTLLLMDGLEEQVEAGWGLENIIALVGIDKVRFKAPLRPGDTMRDEMEIIEKRETKRPDRGLITHRSVCKNQRDEEIAEAQFIHLLKRRP